MTTPLLRLVDPVTVPVPDLDAGLDCYATALGHDLLWRNDELGQAGLRCPDGLTELVLSTGLPDAPNWLAEAAETVIAAGGRMISPPVDIPVGQVADPFGNPLVLVDLSRGRYRTGGSGRVTGVDQHQEPDRPGDVDQP